MDEGPTSSVIRKFQNFIERYYLTTLIDNLRKDKKYLVIDFNDLSKFDFELAERLLDQTEDVMSISELAIERLDLDNSENVKVRFTNLPSSQQLMIKNIRSKHYHKLYSVDGIIKQVSKVLSRTESTKHECPSCSNIITTIQMDNIIREPTRCLCGRKGKFHLISSEKNDVQRLILEELPERIFSKEQPQRCNVILKGSLTNPYLSSYCTPGAQINVIGIFKELPMSAKSGGKLVDADFLLEANNIEVQEEFRSLLITEEDKQKINELIEEKDYRKKMIMSMSPEIYGMENVKESMLYHLIGGNKIRRGIKRRVGDIHILIVTDPAVAKSSSMQSLTNIAPKVIYCDCTGLSGPGLSATGVRDEFIGGFAIQAGAAVLASGGSLVLDELDKIKEEDRNVLHIIMSEQKVVKHIANIHVEMNAECGVIGLCNPKHGRFDIYAGDFTNQIDMPPSLISRFDIVIVMQDLPNEEKDDKVAESILEFREREIKSPVEVELIRKLISLAKKITPSLNEDAKKTIKEYYKKLRGRYNQTQKLMITARQFETLVKLTEANAKLRMSAEANKHDAVFAINFLDDCLKRAKVFEEGIGLIDEEGVGYTKKQNYKRILEKLNELEDKLLGIVPYEDLKNELSDINDFELEELLEKLKNMKEIFEPRPGFFKILG